MLHKRHRVIRLLGIHLLHPRTETRNGQHHHIAHLLRRLDPREHLPRHVLPLLAVDLVLEVDRVVQVVEDGVRPDRGAGELHDALVQLLRVQRTLFLHPQGVFGDFGYDLAQHGVARFGLDGPLAELDPTGIPVLPVCPVRVGFDADDQSDRGPWYLIGHPIRRRFQRGRVNVAVDPPTGEQDQVAEKIGFHHGDGHRFVGLDDIGDGAIEVFHEGEGIIVGHDFVDEAWVEFRPACFGGTELLGEISAGRGLPRLPDEGGEFALLVVGELILQCFAEVAWHHFGEGLLRGVFIS